MTRIRTSSTTPSLSRLDRNRAEVQLLIEPKDRTGPIIPRHWIARTVGEALDTPIRGDCRSRTRSYSKAGVYRVWVAYCGRRSCPQCVVPWIVGWLAPPYAVWQGTASVAQIVGGPNSAREYQALGIGLVGPNATPGVLSVESRGTRIIVGPESADLGYYLSGDALNDYLERLVRAIPIDPPAERKSGGEPSPYRGTIPKRLPLAILEDMAAEVGMPAFRSRGRSRYADGVTLDQALALNALIAGYRR